MYSIDRDESLPLPELRPTRQMAYTSVGRALTELYVDEQREAMLGYSAEFFAQHQQLVQEYKDVFSKESFQKLV